MRRCCGSIVATTARRFLRQPQQESQRLDGASLAAMNHDAAVDAMASDKLRAHSLASAAPQPNDAEAVGLGSRPTTVLAEGRCGVATFALALSHKKRTRRWTSSRWVRDSPPNCAGSRSRISPLTMAR